MIAIPWEDETTLVTGGAGFIGSHLVEALVARGARVRVLDDFSTGRRENLEHVADRIEVTEGDIRDVATCRKACEDVRFVFHQAALGSVPRSMEDPATSIAVNVGGTANVFAAARDAGAARVVYASSSSVYGDTERLPKREGEEGRVLSPYALSKLQCEELAALFFQCFGTEVVGLRYFNVYGPRQDPEGPYAAVVPKFFAAYWSGEAPTIHGDGDQSRDFTYVNDAVEANLLAAGAPVGACGRAFNIGAGSRTTVNELAELVRDAAGGGPDPLYGPSRPGDVHASLADISVARETLGYEPSTSLREGILSTAGFFLR